MNGSNPIARLISDAADFIHNTLNVRTVELCFQRSPGAPGATPRGIDKLEYRVSSSGTVIQGPATTGPDGKMVIRVRGQGVTLELLHAGNPVTSFEVRTTQAGFAAVTTVEGQKQRLRFLGYQIGHAGTTGDGVDSVQNLEFERSLLDLQADAGLFVDANADPNTQNALTTQAGA